MNTLFFFLTKIHIAKFTQGLVNMKAFTKYAIKAIAIYSNLFIDLFGFDVPCGHQVDQENHFVLECHVEVNFHSPDWQ